MNERIEELEQQATIKTSHQYYTWGDRIATETKEVFDKEKFAELIIKECINVIRADYVDLGTTAAVNNIEKHFGVEE